MDKTLFNDLLQSVKEAGEISSGKATASRRFTVEAPDAKATRQKTGLSQVEFAQAMHVSVKTLQNWEQHRRNPTGPAAALLKIFMVAPDMALKALHA